ncbi:hemicentin-1-like isoform X2 [Nephila pilipes]|uniref:Hemicentin-1-like isoform X2 n=1 Tax=Nephila pilipes TaxID=299642 RepID=A0A8X6UHE0_NEPPI|nr:hemicentin-1-like isoform X2 [Nephila pilipes]
MSGLYILKYTRIYFLSLGIAGREHVVAGFIGDSAVLPCEVDLPSCGKVYFITWTKNVSNEWKREYLYSDGVARAMGDFSGPERATFSLNNHSAHLKLHGLTVQDEGTYKCDVTYVRGKCPSLSFTRLYTLITPSTPEMEVEGKKVRNGSTVGPYAEGSTFVLECKSSGGRPAPEVTWWNGTKPLPVKTTVLPEGNGTYFVTSTARFVLSRWDLGGKVECRVRTNASSQPAHQWIKLDIHVRPASLNVRGPTTPVVAGEMVSLTCTVEGARPAANITWYNRSEVIGPQPMTTMDLMSDGTYRTASSLVLVASRYDHKGEFFCKGINEVLRKRLEAPLLQATTLEVLYPPAVFVTPDGTVTVQETSTVNITCVFDANPPDVTEIVWYKDGSLLQRDTTQRLETTRHPLSAVLALYNLSRQDSGIYTCHVRNAFGRGNSTTSSILNVLYPQVVKLHISSSIVSEGGENSAVSLTCEAIDGNPRNFTMVRWYRNNELVNETTEPVLHIKHANRHHGGNYSCEGRNAAGWSLRPKSEELIVHFTPGPSSILQQQDLAVKGRAVTLECRVLDLGHPQSTMFEWHKGSTMLNETGPLLHLKPVTVSTQGNYSCAAVNDIGPGPPSYFALSAVAPPSFVKKLPERGGVLRNTTNVQLSCHVECHPLCELEWLRNNESLRDSIVFESKLAHHRPDPRRNLFSSISSVLTWNMSLLPVNSFDYATFTCRSSGNEIGAGVSSTMAFRVEYPPENIQISAVRLEVMEGEILDDLVCSASAHPLANYEWRIDGNLVARGPVLSFNSSLSRAMGGNYTCVVMNRHGIARATVSITVLHRPVCEMLKDYTDEGNVVLSCRSSANPAAFNFSWFRNNDSIFSETRENNRQESIIALSGSNPNVYGKYSCIAANDIGASDPCSLDLTALPSPAGWVQLLLQEENLLIVAGISGGIGVLLIILLTTAVAIVLRRRMKANSKEALQERHHPENGDRAADCTPIGASPLLSGHRQDDSPLLRKKFPDHEFVYHDPSMEKSNGIYRNQQGRKLVG